MNTNGRGTRDTYRQQPQASTYTCAHGNVIIYTHQHTSTLTDMQNINGNTFVYLRTCTHVKIKNTEKYIVRKNTTGLNENGPHMLTDLNTQTPGSSTI